MSRPLSFSEICKTAVISLLMGGVYMMAVFLLAPLLAIPIPLYVTPFLLLLSASLTAASILRGFGSLGDRAEHSHIAHASPLRFCLCAAPPMFLLLMVEGCLMFFARLSVIGYDVLALTLLLRGTASADITYLFDLPTVALPYFLLASVLLTAVYTATAYLSYRRGYRRREAERQALISGDAAFMQEENRRYHTPSAKKFRFIPLLNLYPFFPWLLGYVLRPELKLRRFLPRLLLITAVGLALEYIPTFLKDATLPPLLIYIVSAAPLYLLGIVACTVILADLKTRK